METVKRSKLKRILLWIMAILGGIILVAGIIGYFYGNSFIKRTLEEAVQRETKGLYKADIGSIYYGLFNGNLYVRKMTITPDTSVYNAMDPDSAPAMLISLSVKFMKVIDLQLRNVLVKSRLVVQCIEVDKPELNIWRMKAHAPDTAVQSADTIHSIPLPKKLNYVSVGEILMKAGSLSFVNDTTDSAMELIVPSFDIRIINLWVDSAWRTDPRIFNTDDITLVLREIRQQSGNGMYAIHFGEVGISTSLHQVYVNRLHLEPLYNRHDFSRKLGYQTDRLDIEAGRITLSGVDWKELLREEKLIAGKLRIDSLVLDDYRDKRVPMRPGFKPPMPQQLVRDLKPYIRIDSVEIAGGKATYSEQVADDPGTIFFDQINGLLQGFTNDSTWLSNQNISPLTATAYLQGSGRLDAKINFIFGDKLNRFTLSATLGPFNLKKINPMLTKLVPAEIGSGILSKLIIPEIRFNDNHSTGNLIIYYTGLTFKVIDEKNSTWSGIKTGVINFVASDFLIQKSNPQQSGKLNSGIVFFQRDKHKSIINFIWKTVFSGIKSNMGFNSKKQKEIKKEKTNPNAKKK
ncbi:MAG: DUF748 domain-containing protein [Bacteroidales bacterium]|nr:DUF748 domain-containing protein [Bacteroidales bacterium]